LVSPFRKNKMPKVPKLREKKTESSPHPIPLPLTSGRVNHRGERVLDNHEEHEGKNT
jgi:hypothetical protein